jgi:hypothetical protein
MTAQLDMFGEAERPEVSAAADPERVRRKLDAMLAEARSAGGAGLPSSRRRLMETVVPQMIRWLPDDEAERIRAAFGDALAA